MALNNDQESAVEWILKKLLEEPDRYMTLIGAGGTGKTFCIMTAVEMLQKAGMKVLLTAPTNKAVKQLEKAAREYGLVLDEVDFSTIHSALGLAMLPNEDQKFAVRAGRGVIEVFDVIVVDEASMMPRKALFEHLVPDCEEGNTKVVFMGDDLQLPPPREPISPVFKEFPQFRLEHNERQKEGQLLTVNGMLRTAMMGNKPFKAPELDGDQITEIKAADFLKQVVAAFDKDTDLDSQRVLAWTNKRVQTVNNAIRNKLYGKDCDPYIEGERVVTGGPIKDDEGHIVLGTDEECTVYHVADDYVEDESTGETYRTIRLVLDPLYEAGKVIAQVLHEDSVEAFEARKEALANAARKAEKSDARRLWAQFWSFKETFADVRYCYCITIHRSQGSTFDRVFVDVKDILRNNNRIERQRLLYVGYSRPRSQLWVNKSRFAA